jgi:hypothetical protein
MQTITTKYVSPTATSGAKIRATTTGGDKVTVPFNYDDAKMGHVQAAQKLKDKLGWKGEMVGGDAKDGYVFVFVNDDLRVNPVPPLKSKKTTKSTIKPIKKNKTNYKGKYPDNIAMIYGGSERGTVYVQTNAGDLYLIHAKDVGNISPKLKTNIHDYLNQNCKGCEKKAVKVKANPRRSSAAHSAFKSRAEVSGLKGQYLVMKSEDGKNFTRLATFVLKSNAIDYANAYAKAAPKLYIKVDKI